MDDLRAVIANRKRREKFKERGYWSVDFNALIGSPDIVDDEVSEARAKARERKPTPRQSILMTIGKPEHKEQPPKSAAEIMAERNLLSSMLSEWREKNLWCFNPKLTGWLYAIKNFRGGIIGAEQTLMEINRKPIIARSKWQK